MIWTHTPTKWDNSFLEILYGTEWELTKSPAGAHQWKPKDNGWANSVPTAFGNGKTHPSMLTTDLSMRFDPAYGKTTTRRWLDHPEELSEAFAKAWFRCCTATWVRCRATSDHGSRSRNCGRTRYRRSTTSWSTPPRDIAALKAKVLKSGLSVSDLVSTAWSSAAAFRGIDKRGGANGARIRLEPQKPWAVNEPKRLDKVLPVLEKIQKSFNRSAAGGRKISLADLIVLAGSAAVEKAAADAGVKVKVPFHPGRTDASQAHTDVHSFAALEPRADGFRNYARKGEKLPLERLLLDKSYMLNLTGPEMTAVVGGDSGCSAPTTAAASTASSPPRPVY